MSSNLVVVPVSVTDSAGRIVSDLSVEAFRVEEDGVPVEIRRMGDPGEKSLDLSLLFDISGSVRAKFGFERQAAARFLEKILRPRDTVSIVTIESRPRIVLPKTSDLGVALKVLDSLKPTGEATAFYDSVVLAAAGASMSQGARRVLVAVSDGADNRSDRALFHDAMLAVQQSDCVFFSINPAGQSIRLNKISLAGQEELALIAAQTGGQAFLAEEPAELDGILDRISAEIHDQYLLGYYSPNSRADGGFRSIRVDVPSRPELRIRARQGYFASRRQTRPN